MRKIAIVTATRAEYGILRPLIFRLNQENGFEVQLYVTGTHLLEKYGNTQKEIVTDGVRIYKRIPILEEGNTPYDISVTMANAIKGFAEAFRQERPDLLIVLGDRTEILGICCAAMNENIPIAHLHGGELTEGAVDDCVRHAVTKMSYLHFPAAEVYRQRIIQMGEDPERVINAGALGVENILKVPLLDRQQLSREIGIPENGSYAVVTFHPVTLEWSAAKEQVQAFIDAMREEHQYFYLITKANADAGGDEVNRMLEAFAAQAENVKLTASLGMVRYLSAVKHSAFVLGNSSSGIIEAPALGTPTVNVGDRQRGRLMADTVVNCGNTKEEIVAAIETAAKLEHKKSMLFGNGNTSEIIMETIRQVFAAGKIDLKKKFYTIGERQEFEKR